MSFGANQGLKVITFEVSISATGPSGKTTASFDIVQHAPIKMAIFGDSVAYQDSPEVARSLSAANPDIQLTTQVWPGINICFWRDSIAKTLRQERPVAVILQFEGFGAGSCAKDADPNTVSYSDQDVKQIKNTYAAEISILLKRGVGLVEIVPLPIRYRDNPVDIVHDDLMRHTLLDVVTAASSSKVIYGDAGSSLLDDQGHYTKTLPCLAKEKTAAGHCWGPIIAGVPANYVRADDGVHLCNVFWPTTGTTPRTGCPGYGYSSGAFRMGKAIAAPILSFFSWA